MSILALTIVPLKTLFPISNMADRFSVSILLLSLTANLWIKIFGIEQVNDTDSVFILLLIVFIDTLAFLQNKSSVTAVLECLFTFALSCL